MPTAEELSDPSKWMAGNTRYLHEVAATGGTHQQLSAAVAFHTGNVCTVRHAKIDALELRLNRKEKQTLGWEPGTRVRKIPLTGGALLALPAADADIPEFLKTAIAAAGPPPLNRADMQKLDLQVRVCQGCNTEFLTTAPSCRFCDKCGKLRAVSAALRRALRRFREVTASQSPVIGNCDDLALIRVDAAEAEQLLDGMRPHALPKARRPKGTGSISKRGRFWYISYREGGKAHQESTHSDDLEFAERLLRQRQRAAQRAPRTLAARGSVASPGASSGRGPHKPMHLGEAQAQTHPIPSKLSSLENSILDGNFS